MQHFLIPEDLFQRNQGQELEATVLLESYDLVELRKAWWDESYDWSAAIDDYRQFRRDM